MKKFVCICVLALMSLSGVGAREGVVVFRKGMAGYDTFRIPAIVRNADGDLLAFAEARKDSSRDEGHIELVMRKSVDGGLTWGDLKVVWADKGNVCGNPSPVLDPETGRLFMLCCWGFGKDTEVMINRRQSESGRKVFVLYSDDGGDSWSSPVEITGMVRHKDWTWYATGPGHAIVMSSGRIVVPCDHGEYDGYDSCYSSHIIYSDDKGRTWNIGGCVPGGNESQVAELPDGRLMLNMRWQPVMNVSDMEYRRCRRVSFSSDGGVTFSLPEEDTALPDPVCQGSILSMKDRKGRPTGVMVFCNPASSKGRKDLTLKISRDAGRQWDAYEFISAKGAYSDLVQMGRRNVGVLCECGEKTANETIAFFNIRIDNKTK